MFPVENVTDDTVYCSADNAEKILTSGEIWLTDIWTMSDSKEVTYLREIAREVAIGRTQADRIRQLGEDVAA